ncbi:hypothetical protein PFICI_06702 [Pestalotiopsis fici W106-1]|uniref:Nucleoside phosphorylase domain-containing protein n=1 Tax=Pestalotiopsis fici (strain W106-1 / CGMCC3.15140) TaxID=1229662 RepID=W3X6N0_PESFW|nr:uncharacterized protein PFICI_06702 [Pestalotiopsis fici W106-1]ETS81700.1 hypothetical protein PFICI_06702 [Pestalotiopsis fici W106-1]
MCYFDQTLWQCGFWRWGRFREHCVKEYRTEEYRAGEICGLMLIFQTNFKEGTCKLCKDIEEEQERYNKLEDDILRWQSEGNRDEAIEKAVRDMAEAGNTIFSMRSKHWTRQNSFDADTSDIDDTDEEGPQPLDTILISPFAPTTSQWMPTSTTRSEDIPSTTAELPQAEPDETLLGAAVSSESHIMTEDGLTVNAPSGSLSPSSSVDWLMDDPESFSPNLSPSPVASNLSRSRRGSFSFEMPTARIRYLSPSSRANVFEFVRRLKKDLTCALKVDKLDERTLEDLSLILPDLVKVSLIMMPRDFATLVFRDISDFILDDVCFFWRMVETPHESNITAPDESTDHRINLSVDDKLEISHSSASDDHVTRGTNSTAVDAIYHAIADLNIPDEFFPNMESTGAAYSYRWLVQQLLIRCRLVTAEPKSVEAISRSIASCVPPSSILNSEVQTILFYFDWDLKGFMENQYREAQSSAAIGRVITLTGSCQDAQALTCAQYLEQTWPMTGKVTLQLIMDLLDSRPGATVAGNYDEGTTIQAEFFGQNFMATVSGIQPTIIEIGEQLSWLGAALRESGRTNGLTQCIPTIEEPHSNTHLSAFRDEIRIQIKFHLHDVEDLRPLPPGCCWHKMFKNPVLVNGFPISRKTEPQTGLETPLDMMAALAGTTSVDQFGGTLCIKGFSSMVVPVRRSGDFLFWHLIYKEDASRISYLDNTQPPIEDLELNDLENFRHVLGWCSDARFYAGSAEAKHPVGKSALPAVSKESLFGRISLYSGRSYMIGAQDIPLHIARDGYFSKLIWISKRFVLLWDEEDKRAWLTIGTDVLLHLVRASLKFDSVGDFKDIFKFKSENLIESPKPLKPGSAIYVLTRAENRKLPIYPRDGGFVNFEDRVEIFYNILEKIIDHQDETSRGGQVLQNQPSRELQGWDFRDLATLRDPLYPRVAELSADGKCWVDLVRSIQAVTVFGRDFGEIILPSTKSQCKKWARLPKDKFYLAASISNLEPILEADASQVIPNPTGLGESLIWFNPSTSSSTLCQCGWGNCDPVQTLLPNSFLERIPSTDASIPFDRSGAVIFGQNLTMPWFWRGADPAKAISPSLPGTFGQGSVSVRSGRSSSNIITAWVDDESPPRKQYTVAILCALSKELKAVRMLFDQEYQNPDIAVEDTNSYACGRIGLHDVVTVSLPSATYGTNAAADAAVNLKRSFPSIRFCLLVGIGGGVPSLQHDIRLGDVVVGVPAGRLPGVVQYDLGKSLEGGRFQVTGSLNRPPNFLLTAISNLTSDPRLPKDPLATSLDIMVQRNSSYGNPGQHNDTLGRSICQACDVGDFCAETANHMVTREYREHDHPEIHYGIIASGNRVIKSAADRDLLAKDDDILCFEMEAAGIVNTLPCLVIRGVCDYADCSKDKKWQEYAAATAAAYAKLLLDYVRAS